MRFALFLGCQLLTSAAIAQAVKPMVWTIDGQRREALVFLPTAPRKASVAVVLAFHGHGGNMRGAARDLGIHRQWPEAIVVYPQGLVTPSPRDPEGKRPGWQREVGEEGDRDLKLVDAIRKTVRDIHKIDDGRIYATGFSNGGGFTYLLWSARPDVFAAYAPCASLLRSRGKLKPAPVLHIAGQKDNVAPFAKQLDTMRAVREINDCTEQPIQWAPGCKLYPTKEKTRTPFVSYIHPGAHVYPPEAAALVVRFFKEHARRK